MSIEAIVYGTHVYQPLTRLLYVMRASSKTRNVFRRWRGALHLWLVPCFNVCYMR
jgi:hypothetical protein